MVIFLPVTANTSKVTGHDNTFWLQHFAEDKRPEGERGSEEATELHPDLWEQPICQRHYEPLISWPAPVSGGPGSTPRTPRHHQEFRRGLGIPPRSWISDGQSSSQAQKAAVTRGKKRKGARSHVPPPCFLTTSPLVFYGRVRTMES